MADNIIFFIWQPIYATKLNFKIFKTAINKNAHYLQTAIYLQNNVHLACFLLILSDIVVYSCYKIFQTKLVCRTIVVC